MKTRIKSLAAMTGMAAALALSAVGQTLVKNPSFENSIPASFPFYGAIDDWNNAGGGGGVNEANGPFHNGGTAIPDGSRVGFHQGGGTVSQEITGLTSGKRYWIQFRYDARLGSDLDLAVKFSTINQGGAMDETLATILKPKPATTTGSPYYSRTVPFTPDAESGTLTFEVTSRGDSTILLDAVTLVQRDEGNFAVMNPSFEASGTVYNGASSVGTDWAAISGWAKTGVAGVDDGTGGRADNGVIPEQALVAFISDQGSLSQTLTPLVSAENYQVSFAYNAKAGTTPHLQLLVDGTVAWEKDVTPSGTTQPYARQTVSFKAVSDTARITFSNTVAGATVLLDEVKVLGKTGSTLPPLEMSPAKIALRVGGDGTATLTVPSERLAQGTAVVKLTSENTGIFVLPDANTNGVLSLTFQGTTSQSFRIKATGVGHAAVSITDAAGVPFPEDITAVFVAGSSFVLNPSFELDKDSGVATTPVSGWTTSGANIGMAGPGNPFLSIDDLTPPDRQKVLRIQGGGGIVSQMINGLRTDRQYGLQFFYNGRTTGSAYELALQVSFGGQILTNIAGITPAALNGLTDYYFEELRFTPAAASGLLEFKTTVTSGDATLFLDAVTIVPRLANEVAVKNSSFEASAMGTGFPGYLQPDHVAGWAAGGGGYGINAYSPKTFFVEPFFDNAINSDQDNVFFGQGAVSLKQTVTGLTGGQAYTLVFDYNFRDGRPKNSSADPNPGQIAVSVDGTVVQTTENLPPSDTFSPWAGFRHTKPCYQAFIPITPAADSAEIQFAHVDVNGDETFLVDNVRIIPGARTAPTITTQLADQTVPVGTKVTFSVTAPGNGLSYRWLLDGITLTDGNGVTGATTTSLTLASSKVTDTGAYSVLVTDGLGVVGSVAQLTVEPPVGEGVSVAATLAGGKVVISWPTTAIGYKLQRASTASSVPTDWTDEPTPAVQNGINWEVQIDPTVALRFYRLTK